ncbi:DUF4247 domain-containing protein [Carbonactinospora thermoautotrophica]|uniref:DUF4247 domain-containing protein n=1 Tax=Carbonactinospora thermoautotrophica TaxID=1469144 RepID=A0A132MKV5_9ACTN|nr:DUF4247 domain-containing protein [Carbonactinospora thermoautotrophica]KWW98502.1 hypothetical protein LI90_124 [Carbonactinospora thermoautotrophica]MCX9193628.1 DUF4247 domain-containing protein [Carbonactinospora thermoautotrophica]
MSRKEKIVLSSVALGVCLSIIALILASAGSPRDYVRKHYRYVSGDSRSAVYAASEPPSSVVASIRSKHKPADQMSTPSGYFLRYHDLIVAVTGAGRGSRIYLDDERTGYRRWYGYVGGTWGTYSGSGEGVRGGGPGVGK